MFKHKGLIFEFLRLRPADNTHVNKVYIKMDRYLYDGDLYNRAQNSVASSVDIFSPNSGPLTLSEDQSSAGSILNAKDWLYVFDRRGQKVFHSICSPYPTLLDLV